MRLSILTIAASLLPLPAIAQLTGSDIAPGDACTAAQENRVVVTADADGDGRGVVLICNGSSWSVEQPTFANTCSDGDSVTYHAASGGLACGVPDTIDPIWVTPSGTLATESIGLFVSEVVAASDESGTPSYSKVSGAGWINVATNGTVSGMAPSSAGTYSVVVRATDSAGNSADRSFDIIVTGGDGPADCPNPGNVCSDGSVYAGRTPDGDVDFFVRQQRLPGAYSYKENTALNNGNDTPLVNCSFTSTATGCVTGQYNTETLVVSDSETTAGDQRHMAALACFCLGETHANAPNGDVPTVCAGDPAGTNALEGYGRDDWYLPAIQELQVIFKNLVSPGDPDTPIWPIVNSGGGGSASNDGPLAGALSSDTLHFSSSETTSNQAVTMQFDTGTVYSGTGSFESKRTARPVICARK